MNTFRWIQCAAIAMPLVVGVNLAIAKPIDPESLPKVACADLVYSSEFLDKYPKAPAACLEARVYHGLRYAKFNGKVYLPGADVITVQILNAAGDPLTTFSYKPSPGATVIVDGKRKPYAQLEKGDALTFWVSEKRFAVYSAPGRGQAMQAVAPQ